MQILHLDTEFSACIIRLGGRKQEMVILSYLVQSVPSFMYYLGIKEGAAILPPTCTSFFILLYAPAYPLMYFFQVCYNFVLQHPKG